MKCYKKDYPRPQFVRDQWVNLNGRWEFGFDDDNVGEKERWFHEFPEMKKINVPFAYETKVSGIEDETAHHYVWYHTKFEIPEPSQKQKLMLHFEGSDFVTKVWVNGEYAGEHKGGYSRFSFEISNLLKKGTNTLTVKVEDSLDPRQPRGKQRWMPENFGCWYIQTTGIWKTVWMEYVPEISLSHVKMTPDLESGTLDVEYDLSIPDYIVSSELEVEAVVFFDGDTVARNRVMVDRDIIRTIIDLRSVHNKKAQWGVFMWSPSDPQLYDIEFRVYYKGVQQDLVASYFGMREIRIDGPNVLLNGEPLYQRLILDQGYWKDSQLTPPDEEALIKDIDKIMELGYNGLRKHQKTEDERFLYWCDVKGMLVWSEAPSSYVYTDYSVELFIKEWIDIVKQNYNHPSIITWTPINESWGMPKIETNRTQQHFSEAIYHITKSLDSGRPVIVNDGWEHTVSDIITLHDYDQSGEDMLEKYINYHDEIMDTRKYHCHNKSAFANGFEYKGQPVIISEYGGTAFVNDEDGWGYGDKVSSEKEFLERFEALTMAIKKIPYVCGYCYTQVTDVQQEVNGLMDIHRNFKADARAIKEINERVRF
ncbi:MAG TPA: beta galactosidase jelly roll domain-containing protein [Candidatus Pelethocola excrementipullorum]|nr:beta galactosidase jelly roll domain-containing protein [Candidatus Pelethocola excrementipullorum]